MFHAPWLCTSALAIANDGTPIAIHIVWLACDSHDRRGKVYLINWQTSARHLLSIRFVLLFKTPLSLESFFLSICTFSLDFFTRFYSVNRTACSARLLTQWPSSGRHTLFIEHSSLKKFYGKLTSSPSLFSESLSCNLNVKVFASKGTRP